MSVLNFRRVSKNLVFTFLCAILFPAFGAGQGVCPGLPPPDKNLVLIPNRILQAYDFSGNGIEFIHDYGHARLAYLADTGGIPPHILSLMPEIQNIASISFRDYSKQFDTPPSVNISGHKDGVFLAALFGPLDAGILSATQGFVKKLKGFQSIDNGEGFSAEVIIL